MPNTMRASHPDAEEFPDGGQVKPANPINAWGGDYGIAGMAGEAGVPGWLICYDIRCLRDKLTGGLKAPASAAGRTADSADADRQRSFGRPSCNGKKRYNKYSSACQQQAWKTNSSRYKCHLLLLILGNSACQCLQPIHGRALLL